MNGFLFLTNLFVFVTVLVSVVCTCRKKL